MKTPIFTGTSTAIITPFDENGINLREFSRIVDFQIAGGVDSITVCGTTGETCTLSDEEHKRLMTFCVEYVNGRVPVIAGTGSNDTAYALQLCKFAAAIGVDGLLAVTPYYNKTTQKGLVRHFLELAEATDKPMIVYNVPSRTGMSISISSYEELAKHPNINGTKEASGDFSLIAEVIARCGDDLHVWSGNDDQVVPMVALGAKGSISVLGNIMPTLASQIAKKALAGDFAAARLLQLSQLDLINALFCEVNPIPVKTAMGLLGFDVGPLRGPLYEMEPQNVALLQAAMERAQII